MPIRTLVAILVLAWRMSTFLRGGQTSLQYLLLVAQIGVVCIYLGATLGGYGRCAPRPRVG
jgi:hypothetical protein